MAIESGGAAAVTNGAGESGAGGQPWHHGFAPEVQEYIGKKGWKTPEAPVQSYRELEKLQRVPRERLLVRPERDDDTAGWDGVYNGLGRPADPSGYGIEGADATLLAQAHAAGLSKSQVAKLAAYLTERTQGESARTAKEFEDRGNAEMAALRTKWAADYDANVKAGQSVAGRLYKAIGYESVQAFQADLDKVQGVMGAGKLTEWLAVMGKGMGEAQFHDGGAQGGGGFGSTPQEAQGRLDALRQDKAFMDRFVKGDAAAVEQFRRLASVAGGEKP